jgi:hypothetical protein
LDAAHIVSDKEERLGQSAVTDKKGCGGGTFLKASYGRHGQDVAKKS